MAAGAAADRFAGGRAVEPGGHAAGHHARADSEHLGMMIAQVGVRSGVTAEPFDRRGLRAFNLHSANRSKYVEFSRHNIYTPSLQTTISTRNANLKMREIQGFLKVHFGFSRHAHAPRVIFTHSPKSAANFEKIGKSHEIVTVRSSDRNLGYE
jgi:hypothetical protein